ncbi:MAG: hypothetical protein GEV13_28520 [Rhodospirillales bacterium]|nr:hypothetical protein [Rhodospirillales bacterium]
MAGLHRARAVGNGSRRPVAGIGHGRLPRRPDGPHRRRPARHERRRSGRRPARPPVRRTRRRNPRGRCGGRARRHDRVGRGRTGSGLHVPQGPCPGARPEGGLAMARKTNRKPRATGTGATGLQAVLTASLALLAKPTALKEERAALTLDQWRHLSSKYQRSIANYSEARPASVRTYERLRAHILAARADNPLATVVKLKAINEPLAIKAIADTVRDLEQQIAANGGGAS